MTARTQATVIDLVKDGMVIQSAANSAVAAGNYVECQTSGEPSSTVQFLRRLMLVVDNAGEAAVTVTVRASGNGVNTAGTAQPTPEPWNTVYTQSTVGDLVEAVPAGDTAVLGPFTSDRFEQPDGNLYIDWSEETDVTFLVYQFPYNAI
jgi:hypothetical protein